MILFEHFRPDVDLGLLPGFLSSLDPRPAREQIDANYRHGGGWQPWGQDLFKLNLATKALHYPKDPLIYPVAKGVLHDPAGNVRETIYVYRWSIVMILQKDGSFEVARVD